MRSEGQFTKALKTVHMKMKDFLTFLHYWVPFTSLRSGITARRDAVYMVFNETMNTVRHMDTAG